MAPEDKPIAERQDFLEDPQDSFLSHIRSEEVALTLSLMDGSQLSGTVTGFDKDTIMLQAREGRYLIYKHAIAYIMQAASGDTQ